MTEYSYARDIPVGWQAIAGPDQTRTFWRNVKAEVTRLNVTKTDLAAVAVVRDRHLHLNAYMASHFDPSLFANTGAVTKGAMTRTITLTAKHATASAETTLLADLLAHQTVAHIAGKGYSVTVASEADADAGANKVFTLTIADAAI